MTEHGKEYAAALFMLACEKNMKKEYANALETVEQIFREEPLYLSFLSSPGIPKEERLAALKEAFSAHIPEDVLSFLQLMCEKGRITDCFEAFDAYQQLFAESERVLHATITSAVELTKAEKEKLQSKLETVNKSSIHMDYVIDASLMGGISVEIDGKVLDGSLKSRLHDIKEVIST